MIIEKNANRKRCGENINGGLRIVPGDRRNAAPRSTEDSVY